MIKNLTQGSTSKLILMFCLPLLIGNLFQQFYNISDSLIVGRLIGIHALAAVGATAPLFFMFLMISIGFTGGLTVVTAQCFGASDMKALRASVTHAIIASSAMCLIMVFILAFFLNPILVLMNIPLEIRDDAYVFMNILTYVLVVMIFYNLLSGIIRALGDSKTPLYFLIFSTVLNVVFNFVLIYYFKFGIAGSALGTLVSVSLTFVFCGIYTYRKFPIIRIQKSDWEYDKSMMKKELQIALPMALQFSILSLSMLVIQGTCNSFGPDVIAAFTAALRIEQLSMQPMLALGIAVATFSAQNWGAGKIKRIREGVRFTAILSFALSVMMAVAARYIGRDMISAFLNEKNTFIIETGKTYLSISTYFYFFLAMIFIFRNALQGMGRAVIPLIASIAELFIRSGAAIYLAKIMGYRGLFYASPVAWVGAMLVVTIGYVWVIRKIKIKKSKTYFSKNKMQIGLKATIHSTKETL